MLEHNDISFDDALASDVGGRVSCTNNNGIALPALIEREQLILAIACVCFSQDKGAEVLRGWRVAACRERGAPIVSTFVQRETSSAALGYTRGVGEGFGAGYAKAFEDFANNKLVAQHNHDSCDECVEQRTDAYRDGADTAFEDHNCASEHCHDVDDCESCAYVARHYHDHDSGRCCECDDLSSHDHDAGDCSDCDYVASNQHDHDSCDECQGNIDTERTDERENVIERVANAFDVEIDDIETMLAEVNA
jgi:hypothetical protein